MSVILGIDPGIEGGIAAINSTGVIIEVVPMFVAGKEIDIARIGDWVYNITKKHANKSIACIEKVHSMPKQSSVSTFNFGVNYGAMRGIIITLLIPLYEVTPQNWKKIILYGTAKDKNAAIDYCRKAYPHVSLLRTEIAKRPDSGMADALCIARFALERYKDVL